MFRCYSTQHLTIQSYLESAAYMTYRAYATGEKTPKPKTTKKKADSESSPKMKSTQASKGKRITTLAKGDKPAKKKQFASKSKGLTVLSEVALTEAQQMKIAIERSKIQTHSSHATGSGDGVDTQLKVPDEPQQNLSSTNEGAGDKPKVPDVPEYRSKSEEESWTFSQGEDDEENDEHDSEDDNDEHDNENDNDNDDEDDDQENVCRETQSDDDGEENQEDDDNVMGGEQEDEEDEELYGDMNLNLDRRDTEMTDAHTNQETKEVHVTLTIEPLVVMEQDKDEEPFAGSNRGTKRRRSGKEESSKEATQKESKSTSSSKGATRSQPKPSGKSAQAKEHGPRVDDLEEPSHQKFNTGNDDVSPARELAQASGTQSTFNKFLATPIDFFAFIINRLKINNLTQDVLTGPTYDLMKGTCKSVVELEYHLEEVFKATHDQLDWHNPEGRSYPYDLSKPIPLIQNARGRQVIPFDHFINNDLEFLTGGALRSHNIKLPDKGMLCSVMFNGIEGQSS
ncbi:hypothetical protein Tco_0417559 [Tanacetum coccineum]